MTTKEYKANRVKSVKRDIKTVEKEMYRAVNLENYSYAQNLYFNDVLPLFRYLTTIQ